LLELILPDIISSKTNIIIEKHSPEKVFQNNNITKFNLLNNSATMPVINEENTNIELIIPKTTIYKTLSKNTGLRRRKSPRLRYETYFV
jgi:hypothetical protein